MDGGEDRTEGGQFVFLREVLDMEGLQCGRLPATPVRGSSLFLRDARIPGGAVRDQVKVSEACKGGMSRKG